MKLGYLQGYNLPTDMKGLMATAHMEALHIEGKMYPTYAEYGGEVWDPKTKEEKPPEWFNVMVGGKKLSEYKYGDPVMISDLHKSDLDVIAPWLGESDTEKKGDE